MKNTYYQILLLPFHKVQYITRLSQYIKYLCYLIQLLRTPQASSVLCVFVFPLHTHTHTHTSKSHTSQQKSYRGQRFKFRLPLAQKIRPLTESSAAINHYGVIADNERASTVHLGLGFWILTFLVGFPVPHYVLVTVSSHCLVYNREMQLVCFRGSRESEGVFL